MGKREGEVKFGNIWDHSGLELYNCGLKFFTTVVKNYTTVV